MNEQLYRFYLARRVTLQEYIPNVQRHRSMTSTHTVEIGTDDPFRTREVILKNFPGWYCVTFESPTDREFNALERLRNAGPGYRINDVEGFPKKSKFDQDCDGRR